MNTCRVPASATIFLSDDDEDESPQPCYNRTAAHPLPDPARIGVFDGPTRVPPVREDPFAAAAGRHGGQPTVCRGNDIRDDGAPHNAGSKSCSSRLSRLSSTPEAECVGYCPPTVPNRGPSPVQTHQPPPCKSRGETTQYLVREEREDASFTNEDSAKYDNDDRNMAPMTGCFWFLSRIPTEEGMRTIHRFLDAVSDSSEGSHDFDLFPYSHSYTDEERKQKTSIRLCSSTTDGTHRPPLVSLRLEAAEDETISRRRQIEITLGTLSWPILVKAGPSSSAEQKTAKASSSGPWSSSQRRRANVSLDPAFELIGRAVSDPELLPCIFASTEDTQRLPLSDDQEYDTDASAPHNGRPKNIRIADHHMLVVSASIEFKLLAPSSSGTEGGAGSVRMHPDVQVTCTTSSRGEAVAEGTTPFTPATCRAIAEQCQQAVLAFVRQQAMPSSVGAGTDGGQQKNRNNNSIQLQLPTVVFCRQQGASKVSGATSTPPAVLTTIDDSAGCMTVSVGWCPHASTFWRAVHLYQLQQQQQGHSHGASPLKSTRAATHVTSLVTTTASHSSTQSRDNSSRRVSLMLVPDTPIIDSGEAFVGTICAVTEWERQEKAKEKDQQQQRHPHPPPNDRIDSVRMLCANNPLSLSSKRDICIIDAPKPADKKKQAPGDVSDPDDDNSTPRTPPISPNAKAAVRQRLLELHSASTKVQGQWPSASSSLAVARGVAPHEMERSSLPAPSPRMDSARCDSSSAVTPSKRLTYPPQSQRGGKAAAAEKSTCTTPLSTSCGWSVMTPPAVADAGTAVMTPPPLEDVATIMIPAPVLMNKSQNTIPIQAVCVSHAGTSMDGLPPAAPPPSIPAPPLRESTRAFTGPSRDDSKADASIPSVVGVAAYAVSAHPQPAGPVVSCPVVSLDSDEDDDNVHHKDDDDVLAEGDVAESPIEVSAPLQAPRSSMVLATQAGPRNEAEQVHATPRRSTGAEQEQHQSPSTVGSVVVIPNSDESHNGASPGSSAASAARAPSDRRVVPSSSQHRNASAETTDGRRRTSDHSHGGHSGRMIDATLQIGTDSAVTTHHAHSTNNASFVSAEAPTPSSRSRKYARRVEGQPQHTTRQRPSSQQPSVDFGDGSVGVPSSMISASASPAHTHHAVPTMAGIPAGGGPTAGLLLTSETAGTSQRWLGGRGAGGGGGAQSKRPRSASIIISNTSESSVGSEISPVQLRQRGQPPTTAQAAPFIPAEDNSAERTGGVQMVAPSREADADTDVTPSRSPARVIHSESQGTYGGSSASGVGAESQLLDLHLARALQGLAAASSCLQPHRRAPHHQHQHQNAGEKMKDAMPSDDDDTDAGSQINLNAARHVEEDAASPSVAVPPPVRILVSRALSIAKHSARWADAESQQITYNYE